VPQFFYLIHQRVSEQLAAAGALKRAAFQVMLQINAALRRLGWNAGPRLFARVHRVLGPRMRLLVTGGSRFDPAIGRQLYAMGFNILQAYGLTECTGGATVTRPGDPAVETVGQPLKGVEVKIAPRAEAAEGAVDLGAGDGEVMIRGPIIMQGYFNRPDATAATMSDGWLLTGDLGVIDSHGRVRITGRKKEIIILSSGKNIYPEEVEAHYLKSPYIEELCVMGLERPGEPAAERLHAVVVPNRDLMRERKVLNMREILRYEMESLGVALPSPKRVLSFEVWTEELPRTTTKKLRRFEIAAKAKERAARARPGAEGVSGAYAGVGEQEGRVLTDSDAAWCALPEVARLLQMIQQASKDKLPVHPDANIELELGLDSMERIELLTHLEELYSIQVPEEVRLKIYTVRELVTAILEQAGAGVAAGAGAGDAWARLLAADHPAAPEDDPALQALLEPRPVTTGLFFAVLKLLNVAARVLLRLRVRGTENLPRKGAFILSPNHESYLDPFLLVGALPWGIFRRLFFVGATEYFATALTRAFARAANIVPVDPDANLVRAMQAGAFGLRRGKVLVLFPEGERTVDGQIKAFKKGAAILSMHLRAPIVPVAMRGVFEVWARARGFRWGALLPGSGARIRLKFGAPLAPPEPLPAACGLRDAEVRYAGATKALRDAVTEMWQQL
jgi:long-chain acyl-CoA synthetase